MHGKGTGACGGTAAGMTKVGFAVRKHGYKFIIRSAPVLHQIYIYNDE
jgi:hypothetical protein